MIPYYTATVTTASKEPPMPTSSHVFSRLQAAAQPALANDLERQIALTFYQQGKLAEAEKSSRDLTTRYPQDGFGWKLLGAAIKQQGRAQEAITAMQMAAKLSPMDWEAFNNLGSTHRSLNNLAFAEACYQHALQVKPDSLECMDNMADVLRLQGKVKEAVALYQRRLSLTPNDGHAQHLIAMLTGQQTTKAPADYVSRTFDVYADEFDQHLTGTLAYDVPNQLAQLLQVCAGTDKTDWNALDLGCGTGLVGVALAPLVAQLVGVDLSGRMLERAQARQVYQRLVQDDVVHMMQQEAAHSFDLVVAADVFIYIGQLDETVKEVKRLLRPQGLLAFSIENLDTSDQSPATEDFRLNSTGRYSQSRAYLDKLAQQNGFVVREVHPTVLRVENGQPVQGSLVIWQA